MIPTQVIVTFLSAIFMLLYRQTIRSYWKVLNKDQKKAIIESTQRICKVMKKELKSRNQLKAEPLKDFEENFTKISNWYKRIILYFNNKKISNNWERSREERIAKLRSRLILPSESFYLSRKREANGQKKMRNLLKKKISRTL